MKNIKLILEYDGTNYHGWQSQPGTGRPTIQETLELALNAVAKENCKTASSGRTDAGVHALGHVANFETSSSIPAEAWGPVLNHVLPGDIRIVASEEVPSHFHARYSATGKSYEYVILNRCAPSALHRNHAWHVDRNLNLRSMRRAAGVLIGKHDFSAFRSSKCGARTPVRTLTALTIKERGEFIKILLEADAFLMHMARNIVGTLVDVGLGRYSKEDVSQMLLSCDRSRAGRTAPAHGLYLLRVLYP